VQAAQPLKTIVPATSRLIVEARTDNRDIGFVREGQPVNVKLDTFPFPNYGMVRGELASINADAETVTNNAELAGRVEDGRSSLIYVARIALDPISVKRLLANAGCMTSGDCSRRLIPGMGAQVEIKTGSCQIIDYFMSPLARTIS